MPKQDTYCLNTLRAQLLDHPVYAEVASVEDLRQFMEDHVFAVWDFMSLLKRLQQDLTCTKVPWFPAENARAARLINDIVIGEETDVDPDGSYVSHLDLYLRAMADVGASSRQFDRFRSLARVGTSIERAMVRTGVAPHVQAFVAHTMSVGPVGVDGGGLSGILLRPRGHHPGDVQQAPEDASRARGAITILCIISATTSNGTSSLMATVTDQWAGSCSKVWWRTRRRGTNVLCTPHATASKPGLTFGMAR